VDTACLWAGLREEVRAAAAAALGCLTSTYLPAQLALVRLQEAALARAQAARRVADPRRRRERLKGPTHGEARRKRRAADGGRDRPRTGV
jgi:hypothetical protein